jgi:hypothetical protein
MKWPASKSRSAWEQITEFLWLLLRGMDPDVVYVVFTIVGETGDLGVFRYYDDARKYEIELKKKHEDRKVITLTRRIGSVT